MYLDYWQLATAPFEPWTTGGFFYPSESHHGALLKLRYTIEHRRAAAALVGAAGVGKTLLMDKLSELLPTPRGPVVQVVYPQLTDRELLAYVAAKLCGAIAETQPSTDQSLTRLESKLAELAANHAHPVLVFDEAHLLEETGLLDTVRLLLNFESQGQPLLTVLLVGQPELLEVLHRLPSLQQRIDLVAMLPGLTGDGTAAYVDYRLRTAGATRPLFTPAAVEAMYAATRGIPRGINRLADLALLIGSAESRTTIDRELIATVADDLIGLATQ